MLLKTRQLFGRGKEHSQEESLLKRICWLVYQRKIWCKNHDRCNV